MKNKNSQINFTDIPVIKLAAGLVALLLTSVSINSYGAIGLHSLLRMPEILVYFIFGLLHALITLERKNKQELQNSILYFFSNWLLFTAFYKLILLPACGFGYFEWIILGITFFLEFCVTVQSKMSKKIISTSIDSLLIYGIFLFLFKIIVRYMLPKNLATNILESSTAMNFVTILIALLAAYGIKCTISSLKLKKEINKSSVILTKTAKGVFSAISKCFFRLISFIVNLILTIVANPIILLIIVGTVGLLGVVEILGGLWHVSKAIEKISTDIKQFIAPILSSVLETDNPAYSNDSLSTAGNVLAFITIFGATIFEYRETQNIKERNLAIEEKNHKKIEVFFSQKEKTNKN